MVPTIDLAFLARVAVAYALGLFALVVGFRQTYAAWTGETAPRAVVVGPVVVRDPGTRRILWGVLGPVAALLGAALVGVLTWLLLG